MYENVSKKINVCTYHKSIYQHEYTYMNPFIRTFMYSYIHLFVHIFIRTFIDIDAHRIPNEFLKLSLPSPSFSETVRRIAFHRFREM